MKSETIISAVAAATKKWAKTRKAEERRAARIWHRRERLIPSSRVTLKDAAWAVMPEAYRKASHDPRDAGELPAHARQIMYAARGEIQRRTGRRLDDQYFCQTLLPDYMQAHPEGTRDWDVVFDARGHFAEPHTKVVVPLGTLDVRQYLQMIDEHEVKAPALTLDESTFPTAGPSHRYSAILFIEKEGFLPLFQAVHLAERYDIAIMSTKGLAGTAGRHLVDTLCHEGVPLLVLHDFDKAGFSILGTLQRDTRRYAFAHDVEVIDLGLRLADVEAHGLEAEDVRYGRSNPTWNLRENGATKEEIAFLCRRQGHEYVGRRVELNAFPSADLVAWIESKLEAQGIKKLIPDRATLERAYRRAHEVERLRQAAQALAEEIHRTAQAVPVPRTLATAVRQRVAEDPTIPWDRAIAEMVRLTLDGRPVHPRKTKGR